jgi:transcriptional regulator with XRE-family HTH domain
LSKSDLLEELQNPEYRSEFVSSEIDMGIPMQLRAMREARGWKQSYVAEQTGTKQPRFSLMERPGYGKYSLNTLKKLASLFDVGLIVSFVPWGEMIDFAESLSRRRLSILSFKDEHRSLCARYLKQRSTTTNNEEQLSLVFSTETNAKQLHLLSLQTTATKYEDPANSRDVTHINPELIEAAYLASINSSGGGNYDIAI